jgi:hypothetical protein
MRWKGEGRPVKSQRKPQRALIILLLAGLGVGAAALIAATALVGLDPAFAVAVDFLNAAGRDALDDDGRPLETWLDDALIAHIAATCPDGDAAACIRATTPPEWGGMLSTVFRRAEPDGAAAWDVLGIATYAADQGFSGVCIYARVQRAGVAQPDDPYAGWRVARWSGFISCDEPNAGLSDLAAADAPNRAP